MEIHVYLVRAFWYLLKAYKTLWIILDCLETLITRNLVVCLKWKLLSVRETYEAPDVKKLYAHFSCRFFHDL
jgi:hypothetical protein